MDKTKKKQKLWVKIIVGFLVVSMVIPLIAPFISEPVVAVAHDHNGDGIQDHAEEEHDDKGIPYREDALEIIESDEVRMSLYTDKLHLDVFTTETEEMGIEHAYNVLEVLRETLVEVEDIQEVFVTTLVGTSMVEYKLLVKDFLEVKSLEEFSKLIREN